MQRLVSLIAFFALCAAAVVPGVAHMSEDQPAPAASAVPMPQWTPDARSNVDSLIGWPSGPRVVEERRWEEKFVALPSAQNALAIEQNLSAVPHRAGTPADYKTAMFFRDRLKADGFDVTIQPFEVLFTGPLDQRLELTAPAAYAFDLLEGDPANHTDYEKMAGPAFEGNSADGDVTGPLVYVNHGSEEDWKALDDMGVAVPNGAIVIERFGGGFGGGRGPTTGDRNYQELVKHKVAGVIQYYDPRDDGVYQGETWPNGNYKNSFMTERVGGPVPGVGAIRPPGDPTLPGEAPLAGKHHLLWEQTAHSDFPEMDVTQNVARKLLASMSGTVVPAAWHDGFEMVEHIGDGKAKAHMVVKMERKLVTIWNVFGSIKGATKPNEIVTIGSHRDAMAFGAIDPGSGSTVMLQVADGFKTLMDAGWKPDRTIQIASWDGHELGLWGSFSQAYKDGAAMRRQVVQYINTDQLTNGRPFRGSMSPELWPFGREIAASLKDIDGKVILSTEKPREPMFRAPGGGSDHQTYIYWLGIPGSSNGYYGHFGAHHSAEDNLDGLKVYDPGFLQAISMAQYTGVQAMRAAGADRMPLRLTPIALQLLADIDAMKGQSQYGGLDTKTFRERVTAYRMVAEAFDAKLQAAERSGDVVSLDALEAKAQTARGVFWMPNGLYYNKYWHTIDRNVAPFPELNYAAYETQDRDGKLNASLTRLIDAVNSAITTIG
ncbi:MAG: M28 family peptidase [Candidatus Eremiobacteraeota bacterium]|nr:M28 family peptidase [Candidatus Eremiobacteraeota bacterium]